MPAADDSHSTRTPCGCLGACSFQNSRPEFFQLGTCRRAFPACGVRQLGQQPPLLASIGFCAQFQLGAVPGTQECFEFARGGELAEVGDRVWHGRRSPSSHRCIHRSSDFQRHLLLGCMLRAGCQDPGPRRQAHVAGVDIHPLSGTWETGELYHIPTAVRSAAVLSARPGQTPAPCRHPGPARPSGGRSRSPVLTPGNRASWTQVPTAGTWAR